MKLQLTASVAPHLHGLHGRGVLGVGPAAQVGKQLAGAFIQGESTHIVGWLGRAHQGHAQTLTGQQQRQAAAHHATAANAHIKVGSHEIIVGVACP